MRERRGYEKVVFPLLVFVIIGMALNGSVSNVSEPVTPLMIIHEDCQEYTKDADGDGANGIIEDQSCQDYPYSDGGGETDTPNGQTSLNPPYQTYWDLSVDFTRTFINLQCGGILANCAGTNFQNEVQFYCWFDQNVMTSDWYSIFDRAFNQIQSIPDDGSQGVYANTCLAFPPSNMPTTMPTNGGQYEAPIADNPNGSRNGGGGVK